MFVEKSALPPIFPEVALGQKEGQRPASDSRNK